MTSIASDPRALKQALASYQRPSYGRSLVEIVITAGPLLVIASANCRVVRRYIAAALALSTAILALADCVLSMRSY